MESQHDDILRFIAHELESRGRSIVAQQLWYGDAWGVLQQSDTQLVDWSLLHDAADDAFAVAINVVDKSNPDAYPDMIFAGSWTR